MPSRLWLPCSSARIVPSLHSQWLDRQTAFHFCRPLLKVCSFPDQLLTLSPRTPQVWPAKPSSLSFTAFCPQSIGQPTPSMCSSVQASYLFLTRWCILGWGGQGTGAAPYPLDSLAPIRAHSKSLSGWLVMESTPTSGHFFNSSNPFSLQCHALQATQLC